jgi:protease II
MTRIVLHITTILTLIFVNGLCLGQVTVHQSWHRQIYHDVFIIKDGDTVNLTKFDSWQEIVGFALSPDSNYCFVRHKPNTKNTSYRLTLYNARTKRLVKEIIPGYGGIFLWNNNHQIIHYWGCGTNCSNLRVYDLNLKEIFFAPSTGGFKLSPEKNFVVQLSMTGKKIWVFDLISLKKSSSPLTFSTVIDFDYDWQDLQFSTEYELVFLNRTSTIINLKAVDWVETDPENVGEFYER